MKVKGLRPWNDVADALSEVTGQPHTGRGVEYEWELFIFPRLKEKLISDPWIREWLKENGYEPDDL